MYVGQPKDWVVQLARRGTLVTGRVIADGRTLLPVLHASSPADALRYVQAALEDMREGDVAELCLQTASSTLGSATYKVTSPESALAWLEEALDVRAGGAGDEPDAAPITGTRLKRPPEGEAHESDRKLRERS